ncbi:AraC family transcriptional regulator [Chloroflexi bacterium TSY]|nr:AraC family transcriptional regulator [Chloroflexi bacterium TSY]
MHQNSEDTLKEYQRRVFETMNYISDHTDKNLSLEEIAQIAHFSKFHFHRIFKVFTGETVADFTRRIRLEKAANLLYFNPEQSITSIAFECGFSSSQNFAKQFSRYFGLSPTYFRQNNRKQDSLETINEKISAQSKQTLISPDIEKYQSMNVIIQSLPSFSIAYLRFIEAYETKATQRGIQKLIDLLTEYHLDFSSIVGIVWDNPEITLLEKCRYDLGVIIEPDAQIPDVLNIQEIPGGDYAVYRCEVSDNDLEQPWDDFVTAWLPYSGYLPSLAPGYEIFHKYNIENLNESWIMDICLPVTPL